MDVSMGTGTLLVALAVGLFCYAISNRRKKNKNNNRAPPSLPRLPIVGSLPFLSGLSKLHICLTEKCKTYGNIFSLYVGSRYVVVLSGHELIREALVKNSMDYSSRGDVYVINHVWEDSGKGVVFIEASEAQRKTRSLCLSVLKNFGLGSQTVMEQRIQEEVSNLLQYVRSMNASAWYPAHILEHSTMNVIYSLMFGKRFPYDDPQGQELVNLTRDIVASLDVVFDVFPLLAKLPFNRKRMENSTRLYRNFLKFCESKVEESLRMEDDEMNFVKEYIKLDGSMADKRNLAVIVRDLIGGGSETTSGQLDWALILLANHPEVQSRLQKVIDSIVPRDRLPSLADKEKLMYMEAVILEVLRLKTAIPLSVPRKTLNPTVVGGYDIPGGTEIIANLWSANMDPEVWEKPEKFMPERFLDKDESIVNRELMITFSQGKRSCLGEVLARQEMFLFLAALVQQFHILPPEGEVKVKDDMCFIRTLTAVEHNIRFVPRDL